MCVGLARTSQLCRLNPPPSYHHPVPEEASTYSASTFSAPPNLTPGTLSSRSEKAVYPASWVPIFSPLSHEVVAWKLPSM